MINAGELDKQITLQYPNTTRDSYGAEIPSWVALATVYSRVDFLSGREFFQAQQINSEITVKIKIRYRSDVDQRCRIIYGLKTFDIISLIPDNKNTELVLMCKEVIKYGEI